VIINNDNNNTPTTPHHTDACTEDDADGEALAEQQLPAAKVAQVALDEQRVLPEVKHPQDSTVHT
jgi:hypothetical protein